MSDNVSIVVVLLGVWLAIGAALAVVMGRRGHNGFGWLVLGTVLGPLGLVLALDALRHDGQDRLAPVTILGPVHGQAGPVDVLVGYDGSPESAAALATAEALLGERAGRIVVATVVSLDRLGEEEREAEAALRRLSARAPYRAVAMEVLHGHPSTELAHRAVTGGFDLLAVGTRGKGVTRALLGSAASELARDSKVPVLVVGSGPGPAA